MKDTDPTSPTTAFDIVAWLYEEGRCGVDACVQERDWCDKMNSAALEIERLRSILRELQETHYGR